MTAFPGVAGEIEQLIGAERTADLLKRWGGCQISIPVKAAGSKLAEVVGEDAAEIIIKEIGAGKLTLPCGSIRGMKRIQAETKAAALAALNRGASLEQVALDHGLHTRTVSNYRAELKSEADAAQMKLPFDRD
ncbi:MAG: hypothetical protein JXR35_03930 [Rhodobacteraceae bacterium]|nr:hypothetical protein [Paracoccaceae bacterium]